MDLLKRLIDQSIMRRLDPFIAMLFIERVHKLKETRESAG